MNGIMAAMGMSLPDPFWVSKDFGYYCSSNTEHMIQLMKIVQFFFLKILQIFIYCEHRNICAVHM